MTVNDITYGMYLLCHVLNETLFYSSRKPHLKYPTRPLPWQHSYFWLALYW